ncbi:MAG TPA: UrcA family protein [Steroidobacteraceae bacterium]|jgi:UrcA family protein
MKISAINFLHMGSPRNAAVAIVASAMLLTAQAAMAHEFPIAKSVSTAGVDFNDPGQVRALYGRLFTASSDVCDTSVRVGLEPVADPRACSERSLGNAVRAINQPQLTLAYLSQHTILQAQKYGIPVPSNLASN